MPIDIDVIKSAVGDFENDNYIDSKDKIIQQFRVAKNDFFRDKLGLKNNVIDGVDTNEQST